MHVSVRFEECDPVSEEACVTWVLDHPCCCLLCVAFCHLLFVVIALVAVVVVVVVVIVPGSIFVFISIFVSRFRFSFSFSLSFWSPFPLLSKEIATIYYYWMIPPSSAIFCWSTKLLCARR